MALLNASLQKQLRDVFAILTTPVTLAVFRRASDAAVPCEMCDDTEQLVEELASISNGKVVAASYDIDRDAATARTYGVDKVPAVVVLGGKEGRVDFGVRFFGSPMGYEFGTLIEDIRMAGTGTTDLSDGTVELLSHLESPLHIQVFVTPTCPYCPRAVLLAHKMAFVSGLVTSDAIDATEFPDLADQYHVHGVPRTVINDTVHIEGAVPERSLVAQLLPILGADGASPAISRETEAL